VYLGMSILFPIDGRCLAFSARPNLHGQMTAPDPDVPFPDRRWSPTDDPAEWVRATRQFMFDSIRGCVARAIGPVPDGEPQGIDLSDEVFRRLHACTLTSARALYALGQDGDAAAALILAGAEAAAEPDELHPAVLRAIEQWCRDAQTISPDEHAS
jgi:hypothetical protein